MCVIQTLFSLHPFQACRIIRKHIIISARWLANPTHAHSHLELIWLSYSLIKWGFSCSLSGHIWVPPIMSTIEPTMVSIFSAHSLISCEHMRFLYLFLDPNLTTYHLNISVQIIIHVLESGTCNLPYWLIPVACIQICYFLCSRANLHSCYSTGIESRVFHFNLKGRGLFEPMTVHPWKLAY